MTGRISGNEAAWRHVRKHPDEVVTFCNVDPEREDTTRVLCEQLEKGARGIGEQKFEVDADSAPMCPEYGVPVLLHFGSRHNHGLDRFHFLFFERETFQVGQRPAGG